MAINKNGLLPILFSLGKLNISISVSLSGIVGYVLFAGRFSLEMTGPILGIFLLSSGASALNHYQERRYDPLMKRTENRPLPRGLITPVMTLLIAIILLVSGALILAFHSIPAFILGLLAVFWYNLVYTYLKRITAFAVVPGALIGAIPPMIGWVAAGGPLLAFENLVLAFFFFIGQIPHFWLIILKFGKEYENAGFRSLSQLLNENQIKRLTFIWITSVAISALLFPLSGMIQSVLLTALLILTSILLILGFLDLIYQGMKPFRFARAFFYLNFYFLLVMVYLLLSIASLP
jgi:protoheme IX farnesyltransferase